jgi:hypothetical protein
MKWPDPNSTARRLRAPVLIAAGAWIAVVLVFALMGLHADSSFAMRMTLRRSAMWLALAPLAVWLGFRFQFVRPRLARSLAAHLAACALFIVITHLTLDQVGPDALPPSLRPYREMGHGPGNRPRAGGPMIIAHVAFLRAHCELVPGGRVVQARSGAGAASPGSRSQSRASPSGGVADAIESTLSFQCAQWHFHADPHRRQRSRRHVGRPEPTAARGVGDRGRTGNYIAPRT